MVTSIRTQETRKTVQVVRYPDDSATSIPVLSNVGDVSDWIRRFFPVKPRFGFRCLPMPIGNPPSASKALVNDLIGIRRQKTRRPGFPFRKPGLFRTGRDENIRLKMILADLAHGVLDDDLLRSNPHLPKESVPGVRIRNDSFQEARLQTGDFKTFGCFRRYSREKSVPSGFWN